MSKLNAYNVTHAQNLEQNSVWNERYTSVFHNQLFGCCIKTNMRIFTPDSVLVAFVKF